MISARTQDFLGSPEAEKRNQKEFKGVFSKQKHWYYVTIMLHAKYLVWPICQKGYYDSYHIFPVKLSWIAKH